MKKIKVSTTFPEFPIIRQTPDETGIWGDYQFYMDQDIDECDYWIVYDGVSKPERATCPKENVILIAGEPQSVKKYPQGYLNQFSSVITSQNDMRHKNKILSFHPLIWFVGRRVIDKENRVEYSKNYDELKSINNIEKTKLISVISSNKVFTKGHQERYDFVMALKEHFKDKIDVFGRGINDIEDKWDAIAPYKYHIALENSSYPHYWTEKIADSYLALSYPIYYGCPDISQYIDENSYSVIDINNFERAVNIIEKLINENKYENSLDLLIKTKREMMDCYNFFPIMADFCSKIKKEENSLAKKITIKPENEFFIKNRLYRLFKR